MYTLLPLGTGTVSFGVHIDLTKQRNLAAKELWIIVFVLLIVLGVTGYSLRMFGLRRQAEKRFLRERERALITLNSIADAVVSTDDFGCIDYLNPAAETLLSCRETDVLGEYCENVLDIRNEKNGEPIPYMRSPVEQGRSIGVMSDAIIVKSSGEKTAIHFSVAHVAGKPQSGCRVIVLHDMARERELQRRLAWKASRDELTGLLNRGEFRRTIETTIEQVQRHQIPQGLLYIDLDEFKIVNDTCGHQAGDRLLKQISALLRSHTRKSDIVARLGGDEFGILLTNCPTHRAMEIATGLIDAINDIRFSFLDKIFHVGASIGLVSITHETLDLEDLLSTVDAACYTAKERGRNRVHIGAVDAQKISRRIEELNQATRIRNALRDNRLELYYQPIVETANPHTDPPLHVEILVRMRDEEGVLVSPGAFIPVAERNGLMQEIDRWVIHHLFRSEENHQRGRGTQRADTGGTDCKPFCSINISGASLVDPGFLDYVKTELQRFAIAPSSIGFEITETQVITHLDMAVHFISELRALGCSFLLDDFGSGMSSFGYLKKLPVDFLKIDGQFVKDMCADPIDRSMVRAINDIGHVMGLRTIAEYVENDDILNALKEMKVDFAQGYGIATPSPLAKLYAGPANAKPALRVIHPGRATSD
jgi:diguanylate cyclase (GGDEF)-like protein